MGASTMIHRAVTLLLPRFLVKQVMQIPAFLMGAKKSKRHFAAGADVAFQVFADFPQGEVAA
jgi:hypothetical protein